MQRRGIFSRDFVLVAIGQIISIFGNQILRYALPLYLLNETGSATLFGSVLAFSVIPMILMYPVGGIIAGRINKRNIMVALDFATALLIVLFHMLAGRMALVPLIGAVMVVLYAIQGAYQPAVKASVPILVAPEHIMQANAVVDMINSIASMAGPVIGGLLFSIFGLTPILYVSIGCFFASAIMEIFIHIPFEAKQAAGNPLATGLNDLKESFKFMFKTQPILWKVSLLFASSNLLLTSLVLIGLPVIITQRLGFDPNTANRLYGYAQGVIASGAVLGGLLAGAFSSRLKVTVGPILLIGCSLSVILGGAALQWLHRPIATYAVLLVACGLLLTVHTVFQIQMMTMLQLLTPKHLIGKVISCFMCVVMCTSPLGQLAYGFIFEKTGSVTYLPFYLAGLLMICITLFTRHVFDGIDQKIGHDARSAAPAPINLSQPLPRRPR